MICLLQKLKRYRILGYTDLKDNGNLCGAHYLGSDDELATLTAGRKKLNVVLSLGQVGLGNARYELWKRLRSHRLLFPTIISPNAIANRDVSVSEGAVVMDGVVMNSGATIGRGAIVNTNSTIEHDVVLADWTHVASGATICGGATVGSFSMIGAGATVIEGIKITSGCIVGAGATVVRDISEPGVYVGSPARRVK